MRLLVEEERILAIREMITPTSTFVTQRIEHLGLKGFYDSFRMTKESYCLLYRTIIDSFDSKAGSFSNDVVRKCKALMFGGTKHSFDEYLCATLYFLGHHMYPAYSLLRDIFGIAPSNLNTAIPVVLSMIRLALTEK